MTKVARTVVPGLGARLIEVLGTTRLAEPAAVLGTSARSLAKWQNDQAGIDPMVVVRLAEAFDVSPAWLFTGLGPRSLREVEAGGRQTGADAFPAFYQAIAKVYEEEGIAVVPEVVGAEAGSLAADVIAEGYGAEGRAGALKERLKHVRGRLRDAGRAEAPTISKRSA